MAVTADHVSQRYAMFATLSGLLSVAVGTSVLIGWWLDITLLTSLTPSLASMKPNTALCFILAGSALLLQPSDLLANNKMSTTKTNAAKVSATIATLIGLLTLCEYLANVNVGLDTILFVGPKGLSGPYPGRMAPATAANFVLLGSALALRDQNKSTNKSEYLALLCLFSGSTATLGYLYGVETLYRIKPYSSVALHTALLFVLLPCGVLASRATRAFMAPIASPLAGSVNARQILPWILGVPIVLGSLRLWGQIHGYYGTEFGLAISTASTIAILASVVYLSAQKLNASDTIRRQQLASYQMLGDNVPDMIARFDRNLRFIYVNRPVEAATGIAAAEVLGKLISETCIAQPQVQLWTKILQRVFETGQPERVEFDRSYLDSLRYWEGIAVAERDLDNRITSVLTISRDITARRVAEAEREALSTQLRQSQKLQALGTLAGGIAHDFNNILMAISGNATLAQSKMPAAHAAQNNLLEIQKASARATDLVKRILAFSRPQQTRREPLLLQPIIEEALRLLRATVPSTISICSYYDPKSGGVMADATQVSQVLVNLGTNAAFAMRDHGGVLEIRLESVTVDATQLRASPDLHEGAYERVTVTDNGTGIDAAILDRIFDPFFTTKGVGEGTGLGLSVSHGIMRAHGGAIAVTSELGKGSTFSLYFPATAKHSTLSPSVELAAPTSGKRERVLFVDDEESLVLLITRILEQQNYTVTGTTDPKAALTTFTSRPDEFDVLVTDLTMPGMSGFELAIELRKVRPNLPVVMTSGYVRPEDTETANRLGIEHLILKPDTVAELGTILRQIFNPPKKS